MPYFAHLGASIPHTLFPATMLLSPTSDLSTVLQH